MNADSHDRNESIPSREASKRFLSLLMPIQKRLYAYILYHVPNRNEAEDILQEVIATLLTKFDEYEEGTNFVGWAVTVARYTILAYHRDNRRMRLLFDEADMDRFEGEVTAKMGTLDEEYEILQTCLRKLPDKYKRYLHFRYGLDMTYRQIAKTYNISMQSVYRTVVRIQTQLLKCIRTAQIEGRP